MEDSMGGINYWRKYFQSANTDIFDVIENAIVVAASDCPKEFRNRTDRIAEKLFTCRLSRCLGCDHVELKVPINQGDDDGMKSKNSNESGVDFEREKESKVHSSTDDHLGGMNLNPGSNYSYDEAEALTEEIENETQTVGEVLRIKGILANSENESDGVLFESLRRLQLMQLSVDTLKATEIGKAVNGLRKHKSKQLRHLARTLIEGWKILVDEWVCTAAAFKGMESSPDSVKPSDTGEEGGLASPPLDFAALADYGTLLAPDSSIQLSDKFFDEVDECGNPRNSGEFNNNHDRRRGPVSRVVPTRKPQLPDHKSNLTASENRFPPLRKEETMSELSKTPNVSSGRPRIPKPSPEQKANTVMKLRQNVDTVGNQRRPSPFSGQQGKPECPDDPLLEAAKRRLHENYQLADNVKRQRTIQVMELHDIPKQGLGHKNPHGRHGGNNRKWSNGRR
ncbi:hypothetical protein C5167_001927 [Papaver somniferum]|uniref:TFIIS N-terminal domain-containing protein n=1 Tax=Papaver somniferum TaxID=3469 RepID=A0A4Y7KZX0_PAPSO|nr:probable mediator of RNA polymerase II transcription subunit 26b [Papaver somniferum]RZC77728.1 hypothetical protein C5167_001927 [Papaver somniferum]